jgi:hypothetical protein
VPLEDPPVAAPAAPPVATPPVDVPPFGVPLTPPVGPLPPLLPSSSSSLTGGGLQAEIAARTMATQDGT